MRLIPSDPDIETIFGRIDRGDLDLQPDFQRGEVWSVAKQQRLIDSILRDWHVPPIHVILDPKSQDVSVLDGQQRLVAIRDFIKGRFPIDGKIEPIDDDITRIDRKNFEELPKEIKRRILGFPLRLFTLVDYEPSEPGELFFRLNQLSSLTPAEQRNAFFGSARRQVKDLSSHLEQLKLDGSVFGFSNARMAYDDVITRALFLLDANTLLRKTTSTALADKYRSGEPFSPRATKSVKCALDIMAAAQERASSSIRLNKATAQSWMVFLSVAPRYANSGTDSSAIFADYMRQFELHRATIGQNALFANNNTDKTYWESFSVAFDVYEDRATSRVSDISSVVLRDLVLWLCFAGWCKQKSDWLSPNDRIQALCQLANRSPINAADIERIAQELDWGRTL
ncbi:MAG: DUF262 domain-containing protein [Dokdonella sp.]|nr:DUF262 domain-containing protein [Dokdonella sp.]